MFVCIQYISICRTIYRFAFEYTYESTCESKKDLSVVCILFYNLQKYVK